MTEKIMNDFGIKTLAINEPLIFEQGSAGRTAFSLPEETIDLGKIDGSLPDDLIRDSIDCLPEISEVELIRHFTRMSQWNYGVDTGFYPLGSCTMKYNPKLNEEAASLPGFARSHPYQPESLSQGSMRLLWELEQYLCEIAGMDRCTLQPAAGAHGELCAMMMMRAKLAEKKSPRHKVLIPDTAHGTNPASVAMCGFKAVPLKSNREGIIDIDSVKSLMDEDVVAIMATNPNTLGLFEKNIVAVSDIVHKKGGYVYCDGANMNALMGKVKVGELGVDLVHLNLHKTFSTPHGGGGPGAGPLLVKQSLAPYLPVPVVEKNNERFVFNYDLPQSIGKLKSFYGNFLICVRAYTYILSMGAEGLRKASETAVVNANYIRSKLKKYYHLPYDDSCMHECVFTDKKQKQHGVSTLDIAKRLIDHGFHPPTVYFPLVVDGALMIEPTETESKESIDRFINAMINIAKEAKENPEELKRSPQKSKITRVDEVTAARNPILKWCTSK
ncbi:MAG: aminomethyl-transferring glycine dehydrogenase subunit GcvPB [Spirochaetota bacterium]|nr:MAG: aminomethyl-transferring glycine dehydrogenase subunit GcvPB [Spirochaetota bacterium]